MLFKTLINKIKRFIKLDNSMVQSNLTLTPEDVQQIEIELSQIELISKKSFKYPYSYLKIYPPKNIGGPEIILAIPKNRPLNFKTFKDLIQTILPFMHVERDEICDETGKVVPEKLYMAMIAMNNAAFAFYRNKDLDKYFDKDGNIIQEALD